MWTMRRLVEEGFLDLKSPANQLRVVSRVVGRGGVEGGSGPFRAQRTAPPEAGRRQGPRPHPMPGHDRPSRQDGLTQTLRIQLLRQHKLAIKNIDSPSSVRNKNKGIRSENLRHKMLPRIYLSNHPSRPCWPNSKRKTTTELADLL